MSVLGFAWDIAGTYLTCRPDPARPPRFLTELCSCDLPQSVKVSPELSPSGQMDAPALLEQWFMSRHANSPRTSELLASAVTEYFTGLLDALQNNLDAHVLLLDGLDHLAIVVPPNADARRAEALRKTIPAAGITVTMIAHHAAVAAGVWKQFRPMQPFLVCDWDEDLTFRVVVAHPTLLHTSKTGPASRLRGVGLLALQEALLRYVLAKRLVPWAEAAADAQGKELADLRSQIAGFVCRMLQGGELAFSAAKTALSVASPAPPGVRPLPPARPVSTVGPPTETPAGTIEPAAPESHEETWKVVLTEKEVWACWTPLFECVKNFARCAAREARSAGVMTAVFSGRMFLTPRLGQIVSGILKGEGLTVAPDAPSAAAARGVHYCVGATPKLPYDCGVMLKPPGVRKGIGTLLLVRPAGVDEERASEEMKLPMPGTGTGILEVAIYLRRLNDEATKVLCEIMRSQSFVPALTPNREARLRVSMRVTQDDALGVAVTVDIHDLNSNEHIRFDRVPLKGLVPMTEPPLRDPKQLKAVDWANQIEAIRLATPDHMIMTVQDWRARLERLENRGSFSRQFYAMHLLNVSMEFIARAGMACGCPEEEVEELMQRLTESRLWQSDFVAQAVPEEFQSEARSTLFDAMRYGAVLLKRLNCNRCAAWLADFEGIDPAPTDDRCAQRLFNAVSQDLAGRQTEWEILKSGTTELVRMYHFACQHPLALNIAWEGSGD